MKFDVPVEMPGRRLLLRGVVENERTCDALLDLLKDLQSPPDCLELGCAVRGTTALVFDRVGFAKHWLDRGIDTCPDQPYNYKL